eukprot:8408031-Alexandrium_andersonii.AAC.1
MQARAAPESPESVGEAAPPEAPTSARAARRRSSSPSDRGEGSRARCRPYAEAVFNARRHCRRIPGAEWM